MKFPELTTDRLYLRQFSTADAKVVQILAGDREIAINTLNIPHPYLDGVAEDWITSLNSDFKDQKSLVMAITLKETEELIGAIGLTLNLNYRNAELGYWIGKPFWNKGFCTEAVKEIIRYGFYNYRLHKIFATHFANNPASGKVMCKAGMQYEATFKSHIWHYGIYKDLIYCSVYNSEEH